MRVAKIQIRNILGIEELELEPGQMTVVEGLNGKGKTSVIEAIRSVLEGGHDVTLLRKGAEKGEVVILLDDQTEIRKTITEKGSDLSFIHPELGPLRQPKGHVEKLFDALSANPIAFLTADPKRQLEIFLETIPFEFDPENVREVLGDAVELEDVDLVGRPLDVIERLHRRVYDERTGVNRAAKEKQATVEQLSRSLPASSDEEEDVEGDLARIEEVQRSLPSWYAEEIGAIRERADAAIEEATDSIDDQIATLRKQLTALEYRRSEIAKELEAKRDQELSAAAAAKRIRENGVKSRLETLRERLKAKAAADNTRQTVATMKQQVDHLTQRSQRLTQKLAELDGLKLGLLRRIPIKGVEIIDGTLHKDGIPFHRLNRAEQVKIAIRLAQLRAGEVPLVCVDGIEVLDAPTFQAFARNAPKAGLQFVITKVWHGEGEPPEGLQVTTAGETAEVGS